MAAASKAQVDVVDLTGDTDDEAVAAGPPAAKRARGGAAGGGTQHSRPVDDELICDAPQQALRGGDADGGGSDDDIQLVGVTGEVRGALQRCLRWGPWLEAGTQVLGTQPLAARHLTRAPPQIPLADYPHPRHECLNFSFALTPPATFCGKVRTRCVDACQPPL